MIRIELDESTKSVLQYTKKVRETRSNKKLIVRPDDYPDIDLQKLSDALFRATYNIGWIDETYREHLRGLIMEKNLHWYHILRSVINTKMTDLYMKCQMCEMVRGVVPRVQLRSFADRTAIEELPQLLKPTFDFLIKVILEVFEDEDQIDNWRVDYRNPENVYYPPLMALNALMHDDFCRSILILHCREKIQNGIQKVYDALADSENKDEDAIGVAEILMTLYDESTQKTVYQYELQTHQIFNFKNPAIRVLVTIFACFRYQTSTSEIGDIFIHYAEIMRVPPAEVIFDMLHAAYLVKSEESIDLALLHLPKQHRVDFRWQSTVFFYRKLPEVIRHMGNMGFATIEDLKNALEMAYNQLTMMLDIADESWKNASFLTLLRTLEEFMDEPTFNEIRDRRREHMKSKPELISLAHTDGDEIIEGSDIQCLLKASKIKACLDNDEEQEFYEEVTDTIVNGKCDLFDALAMTLGADGDLGKVGKWAVIMNQNAQLGGDGAEIDSRMKTFDETFLLLSRILVKNPSVCIKLFLLGGPGKPELQPGEHDIEKSIFLKWAMSYIKRVARPLKVDEEKAKEMEREKQEKEEEEAKEKAEKIQKKQERKEKKKNKELKKEEKRQVKKKEKEIEKERQKERQRRKEEGDGGEENEEEEEMMDEMEEAYKEERKQKKRMDRLDREEKKRQKQMELERKKIQKYQMQMFEQARKNAPQTEEQKKAAAELEKKKEEEALELKLQESAMLIRIENADVGIEEEFEEPEDTFEEVHEKEKTPVREEEEPTGQAEEPEEMETDIKQELEDSTQETEKVPEETPADTAPVENDPQENTPEEEPMDTSDAPEEKPETSEPAEPVETVPSPIQTRNAPGFIEAPSTELPENIFDDDDDEMEVAPPPAKRPREHSPEKEKEPETSPVKEEEEEPSTSNTEQPPEESAESPEKSPEKETEEETEAQSENPSDETADKPEEEQTEKPKTPGENPPDANPSVDQISDDMANMHTTGKDQPTQENPPAETEAKVAEEGEKPSEDAEKQTEDAEKQSEDVEKNQETPKSKKKKAFVPVTWQAFQYPLPRISKSVGKEYLAMLKEGKPFWDVDNQDLNFGALLAAVPILGQLLLEEHEDKKHRSAKRAAEDNIVLLQTILDAIAPMSCLIVCLIEWMDCEKDSPARISLAISIRGALIRSSHDENNPHRDKWKFILSTVELLLLEMIDRTPAFPEVTCTAFTTARRFCPFVFRDEKPDQLKLKHAWYYVTQQLWTGPHALRVIEHANIAGDYNIWTHIYLSKAMKSPCGDKIKSSVDIIFALVMMNHYDSVMRLHESLMDFWLVEDKENQLDGRHDPLALQSIIRLMTHIMVFAEWSLMKLREDESVPREPCYKGDIATPFEDDPDAKQKWVYLLDSHLDRTVNRFKKILKPAMLTVVVNTIIQLLKSIAHLENCPAKELLIKRLSPDLIFQIAYIEPVAVEFPLMEAYCEEGNPEHDQLKMLFLCAQRRSHCV